MLGNTDSFLSLLPSCHSRALVTLTFVPPTRPQSRPPSPQKQTLASCTTNLTSTIEGLSALSFRYSLATTAFTLIPWSKHRTFINFINATEVYLPTGKDLLGFGCWSERRRRPRIFILTGYVWKRFLWQPSSLSIESPHHQSHAVV